jgi:hypothetical protein
MRQRLAQARAHFKSKCSCAVAAFLESLSGQEADACPFSVIVMQQLPRLYYEMDRFHSE